MKLPTNPKLARIYRVDDRQIARWKAAKAPLANVAAMELFFAGRQNAPEHLKSISDALRDQMQSEIDKLTGGIQTAKAAPKRRIAVDPEAVKALPQGAEHALRRLQGEEARLFASMQAQDDPLLQAVIRKQWRETLLSLKQYETLVEADKRDSGETITRAQMQPVLTNLAVWLRRGVEAFINGACLEIAELDTPQKVYAVAGEPLRLTVGGAVDAATSDGKLPGWVRDALFAGL